MYCTSCGSQRISGAAYCHNCGRVLESAVEQPDLTVPTQGSKFRPVPWRGGQVAIGILLIAISVIPVIAIAAVIERTVDRYDEAIITWVSVHVMGLAILAVVWRFGVYRHRTLIAALGLLPWGIPQAKTVYMTVGALVASLVFTIVYGALVGLTDADILSPPEIPSDIAFPGAAAVFTFQALAVVTPITEEIFFRGFVFAGMVSRLGVGWAMVISALVFSLFHLSVGTLIPVFVTGLLLVWLYRQTGSLWPGIIAHAGQNALAVGLEISGV